MRKLIVFVLLLVLLPSAFADTLSYSISLQYDSGKLSLKSIDLVGTASPRETEDGGYKAKIVSFKGETLYATSFNVNLNRLYGLPVSKETTQRSASSTKTSLNLLLPYYPNAQHIAISKGKEELLQIDVSKYSACNQNGICNSSETVEVCPQDCTCGNKICESTENYMSCSSDCAPEQKSNKRLFESSKAVYLVVAIALIIVVFIFLKKKQKSNKSIKKNSN